MKRWLGVLNFVLAVLMLAGAALSALAVYGSAARFAEEPEDLYIAIALTVVAAAVAAAAFIAGRALADPVDSRNRLTQPATARRISIAAGATLGLVAAALIGLQRRYLLEVLLLVIPAILFCSTAVFIPRSASAERNVDNRG
jgi:hypothetical protein